MHRVTREVALWCAIAVLAGVPRLVRLDFLLTNAEATAAMTSIAALRGEPAVFSNPLFGWLQAFLFGLFGANEASARLVPAVSGIVLCLLPAMLRLELGRTRALLFAMLLALSPTLWFASRESVGAMLAWTLAFAAYCAWWIGRPTLAAAALGALLATGSDAIAPLIVSVAAAPFVAPFTRTRLPARAVWVALTAFVLSSTGLLVRPSGLGDAFNGYATWVQVLRSEEWLTVGRLMLGLTTSELVALVGAVAALVAFARSRNIARAEVAWLVWIMVGLVLLVFARGQGAVALVPTVIGCAALASSAYDALLDAVWRRGAWQREGAIAGLAGVLLIYAGLGVWQYAGQGRDTWLVSVLIAALLILAIVTGGSLGMGYGAALRGVALAGVAVLSLYSLGAGIQMNHVRPYNPAEPYRVEASSPGLETLRDTIRMTSMRATGEPGALAVRVEGEAPPVLRWILRGQQSPGPGGAGIVLTPAAERPRGTDNFIGMAYEVTTRAPLSEVRCTGLPLDGLDCLPLVRWLAFRDAGNVQADRWLFWLREDVAKRVSGER